MSTVSFSREYFLFSWRQILPVALMAVGLWAGLLVGSATAQSGSDPAAVVTMTNTLNFKPDTVRIHVGETVRWKNTSVLIHTVTADPKKAAMEKSVHLPEGADPFHSGNLKPKKTFEYTFKVPGRYHYFCVPHEAAKMYGTVIVEPAGKQ